MKYSSYHILIVFFFIACISVQQSCTHDPLFLDEEPDPMDTISNPIDTMDIDTTGMDTTSTGIPCDSTKIYFERDILPILTGNCAFSGCHDAATASDGVILNSYENVVTTAEVVPFDLEDSELYEVITEDDEDDVMPPTGKLDNELINKIALWILQGAENLECDEDDCNTDDVSYSNFVAGVFNASCNGCHSTAAAFGNVILDNYSGVKTVVDNGRLFGAINWDAGYEPMPQGQDQLMDCTIDKIKSWIDDGAQNN